MYGLSLQDGKISNYETTGQKNTSITNLKGSTSEPNYRTTCKINMYGLSWQDGQISNYKTIGKIYKYNRFERVHSFGC